MALQKVLCFRTASGLPFSPAVVEDMERYADGKAYPMSDGTLTLVCKFVHKGRHKVIVARAESFGWKLVKKGGR